jgi:hypothetical protein
MPALTARGGYGTQRLNDPLPTGSTEIRGQLRQYLKHNHSSLLMTLSEMLSAMDKWTLNKVIEQRTPVETYVENGNQ